MLTTIRLSENTERMGKVRSFLSVPPDRAVTSASHRRLNENWNKETIDALLREQPQLANERELQAFKRKWEYMYVYAEVGYARAYTSMHYFTFVRPVRMRSMVESLEADWHCL